MGYYLENAPENKKDFEAYDFNDGRLNVVLKLMRQCRKLRQGEVIINLMRESLPDGFKIIFDTIKKNDGTEFKVPRVIQK